MESPVNFTMGVQKQDRHLFLFNDLLLVAKPRSGGTYKLKEKIRMSEIWLSQCLGDVCESIKSPATSFVIGWPTTNVVVTFNSLKTKDLWQQKLIQLIEESKEKEGKSLTSIQIAYRKPETGEEICKTLKVDNRQTVQDSIKQVLQQIGGFSESSLKDFKLWVKTGKDEAPYPLIGHEYPFCIKMNFIRELLRRSELNLQHVNKFSTDLECRFTLRRNSYNNSIRSDPRVPKKRKKHRKPHPKINWPFRKPASKHDSVDSGNSSPPPHNLFGLPLWKICPDTVLPKPIMSMLVQLFLQGPYTVGIFRKSANARSCRELKEKLEADPESDISNISVIVLSSVFKEFLRSLPDCLLQSDLYKSWLQATSYEGEECVKRVISLLTQLPPANIKLLQYLLCMLWHISQHSSENKMSSMNLAVCIGPTLLNPGKFQSPVLQQEDVAEKVPKAVAFLIDNCAPLFGEQILQLFGPFPERDVSRQDSGAEESDSLHSLHDHSGQYRRDDSSIDSLDRDFLDEIEPSPKMEGKMVSLTNLSRDSGLTLSDTQLYNAEEEVESESSSADSRRGTSAALTKSVPHLDTAGIDCNTASYGKNAGISIDGSCYDVVRKRRQGMEAHRTKSLAASYNHREYGYDSSPHLPLQLSQSYSYSMQQDLMDRGYDSFVRNYHNPVRRRDMRGRSVVQRPVVSAVEPIEDFAEGTLRRSASEESLLQNYSNTSASKRLLNQRKRRAPSPPHQKGSVSAPCSSKKSDGNKNNLSREMSSCSIGRTVDRHAVWFATHSRRTDWKRSQSTSKIDEIDLSHDSSTLSLVSSEDSTPQVSRSSSRVQELSSKSHSDLYAMYYSPPRVNSVCSSTSDGSQQSRNSSIKSNCSHKSQNGTAKPSEPPSYLEAINRQTMLKNLQTSPLKQVTEEMRAEQTSLSAKARELYENSVRMYSQQIPDEDETHRAVPASIDCTDGLRKTSVKGTQTSPKPGQDSSHIRLRHLPPVHVTDAQLHRVRNFHIRPRHTREIMPEELRKEINWSVAELRAMFNDRTSQDSSLSPCSFTETFLENGEGLTNGRSPRRMSQQQHTRSRSLSSRSEEESFV